MDMYKTPESKRFSNILFSSGKSELFASSCANGTFYHVDSLGGQIQSADGISWAKIYSTDAIRQAIFEFMCAAELLDRAAVNLHTAFEQAVDESAPLVFASELRAQMHEHADWLSVAYANKMDRLHNDLLELVRERLHKCAPNYQAIKNDNEGDISHEGK